MDASSPPPIQAFEGRLQRGASVFEMLRKFDEQHWVPPSWQNERERRSYETFSLDQTGATRDAARGAQRMARGRGRGARSRPLPRTDPRARRNHADRSALPRVGTERARPRGGPGNACRSADEIVRRRRIQGRESENGSAGRAVTARAAAKRSQRRAQRIP